VRFAGVLQKQGKGLANQGYSKQFKAGADLPFFPVVFTWLSNIHGLLHNFQSNRHPGQPMSGVV
jgi:hypothetical protein